MTAAGMGVDRVLQQYVERCDLFEPLVFPTLRGECRKQIYNRPPRVAVSSSPLAPKPEKSLKKRRYPKLTLMSALGDFATKSDDAFETIEAHLKAQVNPNQLRRLNLIGKLDKLREVVALDIREAVRRGYEQGKSHGAWAAGKDPYVADIENQGDNANVDIDLDEIMALLDS